METNAADSLVEGITAPAIPQPPGVESAGWITAPQPRRPAVEFMTTASYLDMVRLKIESRKRYPETAKAGSIEGRVTIRFILGHRRQRAGCGRCQRRPLQCLEYCRIGCSQKCGTFSTAARQSVPGGPVPETDHCLRTDMKGLLEGIAKNGFNF